LDNLLPDYEGDESYFFVSYAHDEADIVYPEMAWIREAGFNLWYDEGIHVGTVWRRELARALKEASGLIFFCTERSTASANCLKEINFALDEDKPIFVVQLDEAPLSDELRLSLSDRQALIRSKFDDEAYRSRLIAALATVLDRPPATQLSEAITKPPVQRGKWTGLRLLVAAVITVIAVFTTYQFVLKTQPGQTTVSGGLSEPPLESGVTTGVTAGAGAPALDIASEGRPTLAVLPMDNLGADTETEDFSDGMTAELTNKLSRLRGLKVASRWSVTSFKARTMDVQNVATQLGVRYLLVGGVRKANNLIRMNVELTDASTGFNVWSDEFEGDLSDIWAFQEQTALQIVDALNLQLTPMELEAVHRRYTKSAEAYDAYLQGWAIWETISGQESASERLDIIREHFQRAIALDANFALAIAGLAGVEGSTWFFGYDRSDERLRLSYDLANQALAIDPNLSEAHAALGDNRTMSGDPATGILEFSKAIRLDPNNAYAWEELAWAHLMMNPPEAIPAERAAREAIRLHPGYFWSYTQLARALRHQNRLDEALAMARQAALLKPDFVVGLMELSDLYVEQGDYSNATVTAEKLKHIDPARGLELLGFIHLAQGDYAEALIQLEAAKEGRIPEPWLFIQICSAYAGLGEDELALAELEKALDAGFQLKWLEHKAFDVARANPKFQEILARKK